MADMDEIMKKAEEAEKELLGSLSEEQKNLLANAEKMMSEMMGVSDISELMSLSPKEQKKRAKEMNRQLFEMMGITEEDAMRMDRENRKSAERKPARTTTEVSESVVEQLKPFMKNAIYIEPIYEERTIETASSKIGGKPDMPENFVWYRNESDEPLTFLMQINCAEIHEYDKDGVFPEKGMLYFFYDIENQPWESDDQDGKGYAVYYYDGDLSLLVPTDFPDEYAPEECCCYGYADMNCIVDEIAVRFFSKNDLPSYEDHENLCGNVNFNYDEYDNAKTAILGYDTSEYSEDYFKLGGYSDVIQCGLTEEFDEDYVQLCQLSTFESDNCGFMFGDGGNLYFYISKSDLAEKRFDKVKISLQCY